MNRKLLLIVLTLAVVLLATPLLASVSAEPKTVAAVAFRVETWPADPAVADYSKFKFFTVGDSGAYKIIRLPASGHLPLIDDGLLPYDPSAYGKWMPLIGFGGVRLTIGEEEPIEGGVQQMIIHTNTFADGSGNAIEKWVFTFADGTLEVSATMDRNSGGKCVGTHGTGIFAGAKFSGTFDAQMYGYVIPGPPPTGVIFKIQEGTGEIMFP